MDWSALVLSYLASVTLRSLGLFVLALAGTRLLGVRAAGARHAVWTVTVAGMLLLAVLAPVTPALPLRVLQAAAISPDLPMTDLEYTSNTSGASAAAPLQPVPVRAITWREAALWIYLAGVAILLLRLMIGYGLTARLVRACRFVGGAPGGDLYEANWISVPLTVGWLRPRILLPAGWRDWDSSKLQAVLVHEQTHVRRGDWAIALMAGVNRCIFWFHPASWWLERQLSALAEQACDDAALLELGQRENYAQALLDMAAAVKSGEGRLVWEAMAMAKASEVHMRIERILDETRPIPRGLSKLRWAALVACSLPVIYVAAAVQLAPAMAQQTATTQIPPAERPDFAALETYVAKNPDDLQARARLIRDYFLYSIKQPRLNHIFWMIQNHPESDLTGLNSVGISPQTTALNDAQDYQSAASLWRTQVALHTGEPHVLVNAARFFGRMDADPFEAERLLISARSLDPRTSTYTEQLARLYAAALISSTGDSAFTTGPSNATFAAKARSEMETSSDAALLSQTGNMVATIGRGPQGVALDLGGHPAIAEIVSFGGQLVTRSRSLSGQPLVSFPPPAPPSAQFANIPTVDAPTIIRKVMPVYPPEVRALKISADMRMTVIIGTDGHVISATLIAGHPRLADAAMATVKQWVFAPVVQNGVPIVARTHVIVPFRLDGSDGPPLSSLQQQNANTEPKPAVPQRIRVGGNVQAAKVSYKVDPVYPQAARDAGIEGTVVLSITISKEGKVTNTQVTDGHPLLAAAAEQAVMQWTYSPTLLNGDPVEVLTTVNVTFKP